MPTNEELYSELKADVAALATPLFEVSERFVANRGNFLPHGAALREDGEVVLAAGAPPSDWTNSTEVLPLIHDGLRASVRERACTAVAVAESVTVTPRGQRPTTAIKVLFEHRRGLCVAMYLPFKKKVFGGYSFGPPFTVAAAPEVKPWGEPVDVGQRSDVSRIVSKWTREGASLNPGASIDHIVQLETSIGAPLPQIFRDLYATANGMVDGATDAHLVSFWAIDKIVARSYVVEDGPTKGIGFADVLVDSWFLLFDVRASTLVVVNEATSKAQTPEEFWADYLDRPHLLCL